MRIDQRQLSNTTKRLSVRDMEEISAIIDASLAQLLDAISSSQPDVHPVYLTTREVAELTKYKKATLEALRAKRQGPPFYRQGFNVRYREDEVREWMERDRETGR